MDIFKTKIKSIFSPHDTKYTFCKYDKHPNEKYNISAKNAFSSLGSVSNTQNLLLSSSDGSTLSTKSLKDIYDAIEWARQDTKGHANGKHKTATDEIEDLSKKVNNIETRLSTLERDCVKTHGHYRIKNQYMSSNAWPYVKHIYLRVQQITKDNINVDVRNQVGTNTSWSFVPIT